MHRWKIFLWISVLVLLTASSWAQTAKSLLVAENGSLIERYLVDDAVDEVILPVNGPVMYAYGRSASDGKILFARWDEVEERMNLALVESDGSQEREIAVDVAWATWSPQGDRFLYYDVNGALYLGEDRSVRLLALGVAAASFSPNGEWLAMVRTPDLNEGTQGKAAGLWLLDLRRGEERHLTARFNENWSLLGYAPYWTPDGQSLLFIADDGPTPFWRINIAGGDAQPVQASVEIPQPATQLFWSADGRRAFFGVEMLDEPDRLWVLDFADPLSGQITNASVATEGTPLGFADAAQLLLATDAGLVSLQAGTLQTQLVKPAEEEEISPIAATIYSVKFYSPLANGVWRISSWFSHNRNRTDGGPYRYNCVNFGRRGHRGTDMAASLGRNIYAGAAGTVDFVSNSCGYRDRCATSNRNCGGGFGNYVRVRHSNGVRSYHAHMRATSTRSGVRATCRTLLGRVGSTGNSTGCHLHFELRNSAGRSIDPYRGNCNWITSSLWRTANNPRRCP